MRRRLVSIRAEYSKKTPPDCSPAGLLLLPYRPGYGVSAEVRKLGYEMNGTAQVVEL